MKLCYQATDEELERAIDNALEAGYRHIDCAPVYENEHVIGRILKKWIDSGKVSRDELFIVSKVSLFQLLISFAMIKKPAFSFHLQAIDLPVLKNT